MTTELRTLVHSPREGTPLPGPLREARLAGVRPLPDGLALDGLRVLDVRGPLAWSSHVATPTPGDDPHGSGARTWSVLHAAWHLTRARERFERLLNRPLPPLLVRIGVHAEELPGWGGGHHRLPAAHYRLEEGAPEVHGELHLGAGRRFRATADGPRWAAAAHNPAILVHEFGHHVVRHTADPRANALASPHRQDNRKVALDEGTADYLAATVLGTADIYGWHRSGVPRHDRRRRALDVGWTMSSFTGGRHADPHADGTVWASALWSARSAAARILPTEHFDALVLEALVRLGRRGAGAPASQARRLRKQYAAGLGALLEADEAWRTGLGDAIQGSFAAHGIRLGASNSALRDACTLPPRVGLAAGRRARVLTSR